MIEPAGGCLVLVIGGSGVGKDTVIDGARTALKGDARFKFPRRYITRPSAPGEEHIAVGPDQFVHLEGSGAFSLTWAAHGLHYAIPALIDDDLAVGNVVVVNVSRCVIPIARSKYGHSIVVEIRASLAARSERLARRQREAAADVAARLARDVHHDAPDHILENEGSETEAVARFIRILISLN